MWGFGGLDAWVNFPKAPGTLEQPFRNEQLSSQPLFRAPVAPVSLGGPPTHRLNPALHTCVLTAILMCTDSLLTCVSMCHPKFARMPPPNL